MSVSISPGMMPWKIQADPSATGMKIGSTSAGGDKVNFGQFLMQGLSEVNTMQHDANDAINQLLTGADVNSAEVLTTVQKSEMAFRLITQVRNKLLSAYEELNAMRF
jgi:flagellar hook-basal body complex protein FliE